MSTFLKVMGVLFCLLIFGALFRLRHDDGERLINPDDLKPPKVTVGR